MQSDRSGARLSGGVRARTGEGKESRGLLDFPNGMPADAHEPVLRLASGERVFDVDDVPAILALAELATLIEHSWIHHVSAGRLPSTAATTHEVEFGHRLRFGCCVRPGQAAGRAASDSSETTGIAAGEL